MKDTTPLDLPQKGTWIARPRKPRWTLRTVGWSSLGFSLAFNLLGSLRREFPILGIVWWAVFVAILFGSLIVGVRDLLARRESARDFALADGALGEQFPVEMTIVVNDARIATDRGVVWFAEGLMGFSGEASSFVLAASDLAPQWIRATRQPTGTRLAWNSIVLLGAPHMVHLQIGPLFGYGWAYRKRIGAFMAADERPEGERFWPPLERYEEVPTGAVVRR